MEIKETSTNLFIRKIKYILSWTRMKAELNEIYFSREDRSKPYAIKGDIYYAYLGVNIGAEIDKGRPVVVFQNNDRYLRQSNMIFVIPISTNIKGLYKVIINPEDIIENNGIEKSAVVVQQARSISKDRLQKYKGHLSDTKIKEVSNELSNFLYNDNPHLHEVGNAQTVHTDAAKSVDKV